MISNEQLKEFGFNDIAKFPTALLNHAVTISLPSAMAHQLQPVDIIINRGLAIPVQMPGVPNGMIIRNDGKMVHVAHDNPLDFSTPLKVTFTDDIAYDVRIEAHHIMQRAVEVDPSLNILWKEILAHWIKWYPLLLQEIKRQHAGEFNHVQDALRGLEQLLEKFVGQVTQESSQPGLIPFKIIVQSVEEMDSGWMGEEFIVNENRLSTVIAVGASSYVAEVARPRIKGILQNPVFFTHSTYRLYYEPRIIPVLKLVVVPPLNTVAHDLSRGIDLY